MSLVRSAPEARTNTPCGARGEGDVPRPDASSTAATRKIRQMRGAGPDPRAAAGEHGEDPPFDGSEHGGHPLLHPGLKAPARFLGLLLCRLPCRCHGVRDGIDGNVFRGVGADRRNVGAGVEGGDVVGDRGLLVL